MLLRTGGGEEGGVHDPLAGEGAPVGYRGSAVDFPAQGLVVKEELFAFERCGPFSDEEGFGLVDCRAADRDRRPPAICFGGKIIVIGRVGFRRRGWLMDN